MRETYDYLIVGGGMVADAAANGIRERDENGAIGILGEEPTAPFPRPALSKKLWTDPDFTVPNTDPDTAGATGAEVVTGTRVVAVDPAARTVATAAGDTVGYGKLLLATGGHPTRIEGLEPGPRVFYYRTLSDYQALRELTGSHPHVVVVGGGYIGSEMAAALVQNGCTVTLVHPDETLGSTTFPPDIASEFEQAFRDAGVTLRPGTKVEGGVVGESGVDLQLSDGGTLAADVVVVGLGIRAAGDLAGAAGLTLSEDGGIVVDERLATEAPDVYAAGDVATYPDKILGPRRVEHVDNAGAMGAVVGRIMAGSDEVYEHTPMFYSAVFDLAYQAVGTLDSALQTVVVSVDDEHGGGTIVYYLDDGAVAGVLLWNTGDAVDQATGVLTTRPDAFVDLITPTTD